MLASIITSPVTLPQLLVCLAAAMVLGVLNALVFLYRSRRCGGFALTLALLPMAVAVVIMLVNGNIGAGVAVAGSFSLVRFRSVPGTAREIGSLFFAMAIGLACGMGYPGYAALFLILVGSMMLLLNAVRFGVPSHIRRELKITIPEGLDYEGIFDDLFQEYTVYTELERVRTTNMGSLYELCYLVELPGSGISKAFLDELRCRNGNLNISCGRVSSVQDEL